MNFIHEQIKLTDLLEACKRPVERTKEKGFNNSLSKKLQLILINNDFTEDKQREYIRYSIHTPISVQKTDKMMMVVCGEDLLRKIKDFLYSIHVDSRNITIDCVSEYVESFDDKNIYEKIKILQSYYEVTLMSL